MRPEVKICGINNAEAWDHCTGLAVDYLGLMLYPNSPRYVDIATAKQLNNRPRARTKSVAVVVDADDTLLHSIITEIQPDYLQLHGKESPARIAEIKQKTAIPIIKAIPIANERDFSAIQNYAALVDMFLFDAKPRPTDTLPGGNAHSFNWSLLPAQNMPKAWFLAGGITEQTVIEAIQTAQAQKIDLSSGVEEDLGVKSTKKISHLMHSLSRL